MRLIEEDVIAIVPHGERPVPAALLRRLYDDLGWWPERTEAEIAAMLNGAVAVGAWDGEELIGFARAVTDGRFRAYVEDVAVDARYRGRGIGERLVARLLDEMEEIDVVSLFCDRGLADFYERSGFRATSHLVMHRRRA